MESDIDSFYFFLSALMLAAPIVKVVWGIIFIIFLLLCSALISGSEVAFFSLNNNEIEELKQSGQKSAIRLLHLKEQPRSLLATILISNNFINIAIVILSDYVIKNLFPEEIFLSWGESVNKSLALENMLSTQSTASGINFLITIVLVTALLLLFGEVAPKVYARVYNIKLAKMMSGPLTALMKIFKPFSNILVGWSNRIEKRIIEKSSGVLSKEEIGDAIDLTVSKGKQSSREVDILKSIVNFGDVAAKQIMRSRVDVTAIDYQNNYPEVLKIINESGFSRIPVYKNDFDEVIGILYAKDLIGYLNEGEDFEWQKLLRTDVLYVPEAKKIDDLLKEFQKKRMHMAIIVDEYGGSAGIVTLEDVLEEIIGDIRDEFDNEPEIFYSKVDEYNYVFDGKTLLTDVNRVLSIDIETFDEKQGEADSIAGLLLEVFGKMPSQNTIININGFKFKVIAVSDRRIQKVLVTKPE